MIDYGINYSSTKPERIKLLNTKVLLFEDIVENLEEEVNKYSFHLYEYTKDEYINKMEEVRQEIDTSITNVELALVELYETGMGGIV